MPDKKDIELENRPNHFSYQITPDFKSFAILLNVLSHPKIKKIFKIKIIANLKFY